MLSGLSGDKFKFDPNGDGPARYNIIHFKQVTAGNYQWVHVGEYMEGELHLNMTGKKIIVTNLLQYGVYISSLLHETFNTSGLNIH